MFCYQCQETARGTGCTMVGVCGKKPDVAGMQDLLLYVTKGLSCVTTKLREEGKTVSRDVNHLVTANLFTTITNANFDKTAIIAKIKDTLSVKEGLLSKVSNKSGLPDAALWNGAEAEFEAKTASDRVGVLATKDEDVRSLRELITYGLKGLAAYSKHANALMKDNEDVDAFIQKALSKTLDDSLTVDELVALTLETGKYGVDGMALLDAANTGAYGDPEITSVDIGVRNNPGILVSGHDLKDLEQLLEQTAGTGVDVYTHSEMLPAHYYPAFKKYPHFAGNYGNAWWKQKEEFVVLVLCAPSSKNYNILWQPFSKLAVIISGLHSSITSSHNNELTDRTGLHGFHNLVRKREYLPMRESTDDTSCLNLMRRLACLCLFDDRGEVFDVPVLAVDMTAAWISSRTCCPQFILVAFGWRNDTVCSHQNRAIKCGKLNLGDIGGIPRVLDAGQCNDSYSLALIALKLKDIFELNDINGLPLAFNIAWYEQKAVIVLLALLYLGIKNIHLGPTLPGFLSPNVAQVLAENFGIAGIGTVDDDLKLFFGETHKE